MKQIAGILTALLALMTGLSSCLTDDNSDCPDPLPPVALRFVFTHHDHTEEVTDLFTEYVDDIHLYIFDKDDNYVQQIAAPQNSLTDGNTLYLDIEPGEYRIVAWGNLYDRGYQVNGSSETTRTDFTVGANEYHTDISDLFHGTDMLTIETIPTLYDLPLIRNTHLIRVKLLGLSQPTHPTIEDAGYSVQIEGSNITYNFENNPAAGYATATYIPDYSGLQEGNTFVAQAEFKVQRLCIGDDLTLQISQGEVIRQEDNITERILQAYKDIQTDQDLDKHYIYELYYQINRYGGWVLVGNQVKDWDGGNMPGEL